MTRFKKILATVLTVATTASMSMTAFAADASTAVTGITTADRSIPYTRYVDVGNSTSTFFEVTGMTSDYQREYLSKDEAGKVSWTVTSLSDTSCALGRIHSRGLQGRYPYHYLFLD